MKLRFSIRDVFWLTLVVALFLGMGAIMNQRNQAIHSLYLEANREKLEAQKKVQLLEQQIDQLK